MIKCLNSKDCPKDSNGLNQTCCSGSCCSSSMNCCNGMCLFSCPSEYICNSPNSYLDGCCKAPLQICEDKTCSKICCHGVGCNGICTQDGCVM
ncbi:MAG: hypothetical protein FJZ56_05760 [Chlamydiae bacterium]|nr:hypothetical protein [Chlamydiota bacterium]